MDNRVAATIEETKIIVIIRRLYGDKLISLVDALIDGGIKLAEITFDQSDPEAIRKTTEAITLLNKRFEGNLSVGAGTVLSPEQVRAAFNAGAEYIISPNTDFDVISSTKECGMLSIPGAMTPSEIQAAHKAGADYIKIFPAIDLGLRYIKNIRAPLSHVKLIATAGINEENFADHIKAGYVGAGISGRLTDKSLIESGNFAELKKRAANFIRIAQGEDAK